MGEKKNEPIHLLGAEHTPAAYLLAQRMNTAGKTTAGKRNRKEPWNKKSTLRDVAQLAGLSAGTVSKYLNHPESVQEKKAEED